MCIGVISVARDPVNIGYFKNGMSGVERVNILKYAKEKNIGNVMFTEETSDIKDWNERKIGKIVNSLKHGDRIIVPTLTGLGRSTIEVLEIIKTTVDKDISVHAVNDGAEINSNTFNRETMVEMISLFSDLERAFISFRTKEALKGRKASGVKLGRPKGPGKSKLDNSKGEIISLLKRGSTKAYIAKRFKTTTPNLYNWLKKNNINVKPDY